MTNLQYLFLIPQSESFPVHNFKSSLRIVLPQMCEPIYFATIEAPTHQINQLDSLIFKYAIYAHVDSHMRKYEVRICGWILAKEPTFLGRL